METGIWDASSSSDAWLERNYDFCHRWGSAMLSSDASADDPFDVRCPLQIIRASGLMS